MGLRRKGSRLIQIDSESYRWTISRAAQSGCVSVIIETADRAGQRIVVGTPCRDFWLDFADLRDNPPAPGQDAYRPVTPAMIRKIIVAALLAGWSPQQQGHKDLCYGWSDEQGLTPLNQRAEL